MGSLYNIVIWETDEGVIISPLFSSIENAQKWMCKTAKDNWDSEECPEILNLSDVEKYLELYDEVMTIEKTYIGD